MQSALRVAGPQGETGLAAALLGVWSAPLRPLRPPTRALCGAGQARPVRRHACVEPPAVRAVRRGIAWSRSVPEQKRAAPAFARTAHVVGRASFPIDCPLRLLSGAADTAARRFPSRNRPHPPGLHGSCCPRSRCPGRYDGSCTRLPDAGAGKASGRSLRYAAASGLSDPQAAEVMHRAALRRGPGAVSDDTVLLAAPCSLSAVRVLALLDGVSPLGCVRFRPGTVTAQPRLRRRERLLRSGPRHARHARACPARGCACLRSSLRRG